MIPAALVASALALAAGARASPTDSRDTAFQTWARAVADTEHGRICRWGALAHSDSRLPGRFVWFVDPARTHAHWIVFESGDRRWVASHAERAATGGIELRCPEEDGLAWSKLTQLSLAFSERSNTPDLEEVVTTVDGEVVLLSESRRGHHDDDRRSWVDGTHRWSDPHPEGRDDRSGPTVDRMLFALPARSRWWGKLPAVPALVTFGRKRWTGASDADLSVRVLVDGAGQPLRIELAVRDDRTVPPPPDADLRTIVRSDHFELWFCADADSIACLQTPAQLAVAATRDGGAVSRWLRPPASGDPAPAVAVENDRLVLTLPRRLIGATAATAARAAAALVLPFTVAYSDSDDPASGQQTMVGTASIRNARPERPSLLAIPDGESPFPRWPRARPLAPGAAVLGQPLPTAAPSPR
jgi:hypothetical protein